MSLAIIKSFLQTSYLSAFKCYFKITERFKTPLNSQECSMIHSEEKVERPNEKLGLPWILLAGLCHAKVSCVQVCQSFPTIGLTPSRQLIPASLAYVLRLFYSLRGRQCITREERQDFSFCYSNTTLACSLMSVILVFFCL